MVRHPLRVLDHVRLPSFTVRVHLLEQPLVLGSEAIVLPFDGVVVLHNLSQLALCLGVLFASLFETLDIFRG